MTAKIGQGNSTQDDLDGCRVIPGLSARMSVTPEVTEVSGICGSCEVPEVSRIGTGRVEQDGRIATLAPGEMAFYDSTRPYTLHFDRPFHQLVVQVPKQELMLRDTRQMTARALGRGTPGAVWPRSSSRCSMPRRETRSSLR